MVGTSKLIVNIFFLGKVSGARIFFSALYLSSLQTLQKYSSIVIRVTIIVMFRMVPDYLLDMSMLGVFYSRDGRHNSLHHPEQDKAVYLEKQKNKKKQNNNK